MFEHRDLRHDLMALALLVLVVFLSLSLLTYSTADPVGELVWPFSNFYNPDQLVYPLNETIQNACGAWGSLAANLLFLGLGVGAYYLVFSLTVLDVLLLTRREVDTPIIRAIGWIASLIGITSLMTILLPGFSPGPIIGSGGYLGVLGQGILQTHFATVGGVILALSLLAGGLLLCTDYYLVQLSFTAVSGGLSLSRKMSRKKSVADEEVDEEDWEEEEEVEEEPLRVKVLGRNIEAQEQSEEDEEDEEDDEFEEEVSEDEEEEPTLVKESKKKEKTSLMSSVKKRLTPRIKVKAPEKKTEREEVIDQLEASITKEEPLNYELPSTDLLLSADDISFEDHEIEVRRKAKVLEKTFQSFGFSVKVVEIETGPVIAQYEIELESGLRLSRITGLADDIAIALRVPSVRIVAPIPGKNTVGIEVPNTERQIVRLREVMEEEVGRTKKMQIPLFLGKDVSGSPLVVDLASLPHLLIAGRTGTGKSVCLNAIISSMLMTRRPDEVRMIMIDPKMVELSCYRTLPHLMHPVVTDMKKAEAILAWAVDKMEERYSLLAQAGVRHVSVYNQLGEEELMERLQPETDEQRDAIPRHLPFIVVVADEIADLMMTSGKDVEQHIIRLAQKSRAVGIHLILATQKPTVDVITGLIKSNLPARISFQVASRTDSRVVLDEMGADKLLGNGDMLFLWPGTSTLLRGQGTYLSDDEISNVVDSVSTGEQNFVKELVHLKVEENDEEQPGKLKKRDELYESAVDVVVREGRGSVSLLQRTLGIGYGRAARLIDYMDEDKIVGPYAGSQAREVLITMEDWERMQGYEPEAEELEPPPKRSNKIVVEDHWEEEEDDDGEEVDEIEPTEEEEYEDEVAEDEGEEWEEDNEEEAGEVDEEEYEDEEDDEEMEYEEDELEGEEDEDEEDEETDRYYEAESA